MTSDLKIRQTETPATPPNPKQDLHSGHGDISGFDTPNYRNETPDDSQFWADFFLCLIILAVLAAAGGGA